jgi:hypothetical protein
VALAIALGVTLLKDDDNNDVKSAVTSDGHSATARPGGNVATTPSSSSGFECYIFMFVFLLKLVFDKNLTNN